MLQTKSGGVDCKLVLQWIRNVLSESEIESPLPYICTVHEFFRDAAWVNAFHTMIYHSRWATKHEQIARFEVNTAGTFHASPFVENERPCGTDGEGNHRDLALAAFKTLLLILDKTSKGIYCREVLFKGCTRKPGLHRQSPGVVPVLHLMNRNYKDRHWAPCEENPSPKFLMHQIQILPQGLWENREWVEVLPHHNLIECPHSIYCSSSSSASGNWFENGGFFNDSLLRIHTQAL